MVRAATGCGWLRDAAAPNLPAYAPGWMSHQRARPGLALRGRRCYHNDLAAADARRLGAAVRWMICSLAVHELDLCAASCDDRIAQLPIHQVFLFVLSAKQQHLY
jgi:hypothetical protein